MSAKKMLVCPIPGGDVVTIRSDLVMDVYLPTNRERDARLPAVVLVSGYVDAGLKAVLGCGFREMASNVSWARLIAAEGLGAILYTNREPETDLHALIRNIRAHAAELGIDADRIGIWACSGNVPLALSVLMQEGNDYLKCAALLYGYMLDLDGSQAVADAVATFRFANPCAGRVVSDLPQRLPLFLGRAGLDAMTGLNEGIDRFVAHALARNQPITLVNHADGPHAFDILHDSETTRQIIRQTLAFMRFHLLAAAG